MKVNSTSVKILAASRPYENSKDGLITIQCEIPSFIHMELLTHRNFARNSSSNRAMSTERSINMGFLLPEVFYTQGEGMRSSREPIKHQKLAGLLWSASINFSIFITRLLERLEVSKEQRNRLIPPTKYVRSIVTGTEQAWKDFLVLRLSEYADVEMYRFALLVDRAIKDVTWQYSNYHTPYAMLDIESTVARIARVSYNRTKGKDDKKLYTELVAMGHFSTLEHMAIWLDNPHRSVYTKEGSNVGWESYRSACENGKMNDFRMYLEGLKQNNG